MGSGEGAAPDRAGKYDLAIMNDIGNFDTDAFENGPSFQKTVYLQSFGAYPGHGFGWYIHDACSSALTRAGFKIRYIVKRMPEIGLRFATDDAQANYDEFKEFVKDKKDDAALLEISASRRHLPPIKPKGRLLEIVADKEPRFATGQCVRAWDDLEKYGGANA